MTDSPEKIAYDHFRSTLTGLHARAIWNDSTGEGIDYTRLSVWKPGCKEPRVIVNMRSLRVIVHTLPEYDAHTQSFFQVNNVLIQCDSLEECASVVRAKFAM